MTDFLKTVVVFIIIWVVVVMFSMFVFPNATHILLETQSVTFGSVLVDFFICITSALITFLIFSSEETSTHVLIIYALFMLYNCVFDDVPFMYGIFAYIRVVISIVLAKVIASKIRGTLLKK